MSWVNGVWVSGNHKGSISKQSMNQQQKLIQDQGYSNEIFYCMMSSLESIVLHYQKGGQNKSSYQNKMFKHYDKVDYGHKNLKQLKSQLQIHIMLFKNSRIAFDQEHPNNKWELPREFDTERSINYIRQAKSMFQEFKDG